MADHTQEFLLASLCRFALGNVVEQHQRETSLLINHGSRHQRRHALSINRVAERKPFLLRMDRDVLDAVQRWADDELRSLNGQIEFLLRRALQGESRLPRGGSPPPAPRSRK